MHDAGGEDLHEVDVLAEVLVIGAAEDADPGQVLGKLLHLFHGLADLLREIAGGADLAQAGRDGDIRLVVGHDACKAVVLGGVLVNLVHDAGEAADDMTQLDDFRSQFCHVGSPFYDFESVTHDMPDNIITKNGENRKLFPVHCIDKRGYLS